MVEVVEEAVAEVAAAVVTGGAAAEEVAGNAPEAQSGGSRGLQFRHKVR
jgi:hypothetical protein